jgi:hypothetical protein
MANRCAHYPAGAGLIGPSQLSSGFFKQSAMHEDLDFNITALFGCIVGAVFGYHLGTVQQGVFGAFVGFFAAIACAAIIAELAYAIWSSSALLSRLLERLMPLLTLGLLLLVATRLWA